MTNRLRRAQTGAVATPVALLVAFAVVQMMYLRPPSSQDGMHYFERADAFPDVPTDHWSLRIGLLLPVRLFQWLLGYSEAAYYAVPLLAGALLILATYWLGRDLFSPVVGAGAGVVILTSGMFLNISSVLLPDVLTTALFAAGLALLVREAASVGGLSRRACVGAGLLFAWAYLVREFIVFLFPVVVVVFLVYRLPRKQLAWVAGPAFAVFVGEMVANLVLHGNPLRRLFVTGSHGGRRSSITDSRLDALERLPRALAELPGNDALVVLALLAPLAVLIATPGGRTVAAWLAAFWIPMTLGTGLVDPSFRFVIADKLRYWLPILPALALGGTAVVHNGIRRWSEASDLPGRSLAGVVIVTLLGGLAVAEGADDRARDIYRVNGAHQLGELRNWLEEHGGDVDVIWTDHFTARILPLYTQTVWGDPVWNGDVRAFDRDGEVFFTRSVRDGEPGIVVLYRFGYRVLPGGYAGLPASFRRAPSMRSVVLYRPDKSLIVFRVGGEPPESVTRS